MISIAQSNVVLLVLLDLSATLEIVDHNVIFPMLKDTFGMLGKVTRPESIYSWYVI